MPLSNITKWVQQTDTRWQRRIHPGRCVLVNARTAMNSAVIVPIYRAMQDPRVTFFFTASEQPSAAKTIYGEIGGNVNLVSPARAALMKFSAYLVADMLWVTLPRGTRRIQMFHGVAGKYSRVYDTPDHSMRDWDRLFFINRRRMENYIRVGAIDADSPAARLVGYPKLDCLVDGSLSRDDVLNELGIDPSRRTVLYAPTWSPYSSLNVMGEALVQKLVAAGYAVIVKLHKLLRKNTTFRVYRRRLLDENRWRASRYGIDGKLIDFGRESEVETRSLLNELLEFVSTEVNELGCESEMSHIERIMREGTGADRQLAAYERTQDMKVVVDQIVDETYEGLNLESRHAA